MTTTETFSKLSQTARQVLPIGGEAWLFGSRARGTARSDSDWDILILLDKAHITIDDHDNVAYPFRRMGWDIDEMINPIVYTKKDWEQMWFSPFYKNVMQERVKL